MKSVHMKVPVRELKSLAKDGKVKDVFIEFIINTLSTFLTT